MKCSTCSFYWHQIHHREYIALPWSKGEHRGDVVLSFCDLMNIVTRVMIEQRTILYVTNPDVIYSSIFTLSLGTFFIANNILALLPVIWNCFETIKMKLRTETNLPFWLHVESPKYHEIFDPIHIHILYVNGLNPLLFNSCIGTLVPYVITAVLSYFSFC